MDKQLTEDLEARIRIGVSKLWKLKPNDPAYGLIEAKVNGLKKELEAAKQGKAAAHGTAQPFNRTYDPKMSSDVNYTVHVPPPHWQDPRPDLSEDSILWTALLELTSGYDMELCCVLNGFRCGGTRLREGRQLGKAIWLLRPDIDPTGYKAWISQSEYDEAKEKYLKEWGSVLKDMLNELKRRVPALPEQREVEQERYTQGVLPI